MHFPVSSKKLHKIQDFSGISVLSGILHIRRFLKKLRSLRVTKKKAVTAVNVYIWISFLRYIAMSPS